MAPDLSWSDFVELLLLEVDELLLAELPPELPPELAVEEGVVPVVPVLVDPLLSPSWLLLEEEEVPEPEVEEEVPEPEDPPLVVWFPLPEPVVEPVVLPSGLLDWFPVLEEDGWFLPSWSF